jgi:hypothetical protein
MSLLKVLSIADVYSKVCPPDKTVMLGLLRSTSKELKVLIDTMGLEVHIKIKSYDIDNIIKNIKKISENYTITKIEFSKSYTILMIINLDIIGKLCPFLTHLDLGSNDSYYFGLERFKINLPKCNVIQDMFSYNCYIEKETRKYTFGTTYYYKWNYHNDALQYASYELKKDSETVLKLAKQDNIPLKTKQVYTKLARNVRDYETKALNKRFHCTKKSQYNTNALNQRNQKKY